MAEVLIALVVIGIIAAITLTTVMPNIQERVNSQRQANIVYKVTQATNLMKANGAMINGFESTDAFVDELQKYLKIMKRCDSDHIADCWPTKKVRTSDGKEYEIKDVKSSWNLGLKTWDSNTVGIVLADGASIILAYDPKNKGLSIGDELFTTSKSLPVGSGYSEFLEYTSNTTSGIAFVMDVNGSKGPNSETIGTKMYDIRNLNGAHFSDGCGGTIHDGKCYTSVDSFSSLDCSRTGADSNGYGGTLNQPENAIYCGTSSLDTEDYWAGARKACFDRGLKLLTQDELYNLCTKNVIKEKIIYWSNDIVGTAARIVQFNDVNYCFHPSYGYSKTYTAPKALCIE